MRLLGLCVVLTTLPFLPSPIASQPQSLPSFTMSVQILSETEVRISGRKFLYKASNLFTIRDRESDTDYDEDEKWVFENWAGPQVHELPILQQWIAHLCSSSAPLAPPLAPTPPHPLQMPQAPKRSTDRWLPHGYTLQWTSVGNTGTLLCTRGTQVWMAELSEADLQAKADTEGYLANPEEMVDIIHWGVKGDVYEPILETLTDGSLRLEHAYEVCSEYTFVGWSTLKPTHVPASVLRLLHVTAPPPAPPAPPAPEPSPPSSPATIILDDEEDVDDVEIAPLPPAIVTKTPKGVFRFCGLRA